ncbi:MAG: hypothetical protein NVS9B15_06890 [Acidobacteriaceae bacterium]
MQAVSRSLIMLLALLGAAALADHRAMAWNRGLSPIQHANLHAFPKAIARWNGVDYETEMTQSTRAYYGTDNFIDRIYSAPGEYPIELVLLPTGAGLHSPKVCARFGGLKLLYENSARPGDASDSDRIVLQTGTGRNSDYACSYFWETPQGVVHDLSVYEPATHYSNSLLVSLCTPTEGSDKETRFRALDGFRSTLEPEVSKLISASPSRP